MESYWINAESFKTVIGTWSDGCILPADGKLVLSVQLPEDWSKYETAAVHMKAVSKHQVTILMGLCSEQAQPPILSMHYRALPNCEVQVPFPINGKALKADTAFLPPWPGVYKGGISGKPTTPEQIHALQITINEATLESVCITGIELVNSWKPGDVVGKALVDELGQQKNAEWAGKTESLSQLNEYLLKELEWAKNNNRYPEGWSSYGGWLKKRFDATGWFHTAHDGRRWWLVDPDGCAFFSNGMCYGNRTGIYAMADHLTALYDWLPEKEGLLKGAWTTGDKIPQYVVRNGIEHADERELVNFPRANMMRIFGEDWLDAWITINAARMRTWGINTLGVGVNDYDDEPTKAFLSKAKIPYVITLKYFPLTKQCTFRDFPDVYSEEYAALAQRMAAEQLTPYRDDPYMIGYFVTNEPEWLMHEGVNLAERLLASDGCAASKKRFIDELAQGYGSIEVLNTAWDCDFTSFDAMMKPISRNQWNEAAQADMERFHLKMVEAYGSIVSNALHSVDPNHLNLGMRYSRASEKTLCGSLNYFDVFSFNRYGDEPASAAAMIAKGADKPMVVGEWHIGAKESGLDSWGLYYTHTQEERAKALTYYLEQSTQEPHLTGIHYFEYSDQPYLGRFDGECYQIGLIDICNRPYPEAAEAFRSFAQRMYPMLNGEIECSAERVKLTDIWQTVN